jgi:hypothetical protein
MIAGQNRLMDGWPRGRNSGNNVYPYSMIGKILEFFMFTTPLVVSSIVLCLIRIL